MDWNLALEFIITVATIAVAIFLVPWLKEKLGAERAQQLEDLYKKPREAFKLKTPEDKKIAAAVAAGREKTFSIAIDGSAPKNVKVVEL